VTLTSRAIFYYSKTLTSAFNDWRLLFVPDATYLLGVVGPFPWIVLIAGLMVTGLIGFIMFRLTQEGIIVTRRVEEQTEVMRRQNQALTDRESRLNAIFNNSVDGLITIDRSGIVQKFNPACEKIFGYNEDEVMGRNIKMLMPEPY
jgi:PAS domain-containing protein